MLSHRQYGEMLQALPLAAYMTDAQGWVTFFNEASAQLVGRRPQVGRDRWCVTWRLYWPDGSALAHEDCPMAVALKEKREVRGAVAVAERPDGSRFAFTPYPSLFLDQAGEVLAGVNLLVELPQQPRSEPSGTDAKVAMVLKLLHTIVVEAQSELPSIGAHGAFGQVLQAIASLAATQVLLRGWLADVVVNSWDVLSAACALAQSEVGVGRIEVESECDAGDLPPEKALPLALMVREAIFNAARHAPSDRQVTLRITLMRRAGEFSLQIQERRTGRTVEASSLHSPLIEALVRQIDGAVNVHREGITVTFSIGRVLN